LPGFGGLIRQDSAAACSAHGPPQRHQSISRGSTVSTAAQITVELDTSELGPVISRLTGWQLDIVADSIGAMLARRAVDRLEYEKRGPKGEVWPAWSEEYARTRHANQSLLVSNGDMQKSIQHQILGSGSDLVIGVGVYGEYGLTHQFGDESRGIPARPYLGFADDDRQRIEDLITGELSSLFE